MTIQCNRTMGTPKSKLTHWAGKEGLGTQGGGPLFPSFNLDRLADLMSVSMTVECGQRRLFASQLQTQLPLRRRKEGETKERNRQAPHRSFGVWPGVVDKAKPRQRTWLGLLLAISTLAIGVMALQALLSLLPTVCALSSAFRLRRVCNAVVRNLHVPSRVVTVWWGFAVVWLAGKLATVAVRWVDARLRAMHAARRARIARRSSSMSENAQDVPLKGRRCAILAVCW